MAALSATVLTTTAVGAGAGRLWRWGRSPSSSSGPDPDNDGGTSGTGGKEEEEGVLFVSEYVHFPRFATNASRRRTRLQRWLLRLLRRGAATVTTAAGKDKKPMITIRTWPLWAGPDDSDDDEDEGGGDGNSRFRRWAAVRTAR